MERLPIGGLFLPLMIERTTYAECEVRGVDQDVEALKVALSEHMFTLLEANIAAQGANSLQIVDKWIDYSMIERVVCALARCWKYAATSPRRGTRSPGGIDAHYGDNDRKCATDVLRVDVPEQFIALFGIREENMRLFREELDVDIYVHGGEVTFTGDADKVALARLTLEKLLEIIQRGDPVDRTRIRYAIELASEGNADRIGEIMRDVIAITHRGRQVKCKTLGQKQYVDAIKQNTCTFAVGPAGTGKTYLAIAMAVVALKSKDVSASSSRARRWRPAKARFPARRPGAEGRSLSAPPSTTRCTK